MLSSDRDCFASELGITTHQPPLPTSEIVIVLFDGSTEDLIASFEGFDTMIALGSPASLMQARMAMTSASTLLLENIHLTDELYADMLQFKGRLLVITCHLHRPPPKHILSKVYTLILEDTRSFPQILEFNKTMVSDSRIAFIHTWICYKERACQFSEKYGFTLEDMRMADKQPCLKHVMSIYTSRIKPDSFDWKQVGWLIRESHFG